MDSITVCTGESPDVTAFLAERIYEHNARATGCHDGESYWAVVRGDAGDIVAGVSGFTWAGCCFVAYLWVTEALRGRGLGRRLLEAVENHARSKRCPVVHLSTHEFQAPDFYARLGYEAVARVEDYPVGHADVFFTKRLEMPSSA